MASLHVPSEVRSSEASSAKPSRDRTMDPTVTGGHAAPDCPDLPHRLPCPWTEWVVRIGTWRHLDIELLAFLPENLRRFSTSPPDSSPTSRVRSSGRWPGTCVVRTVGAPGAARAVLRGPASWPTPRRRHMRSPDGICGDSRPGRALPRRSGRRPEGRDPQPARDAGASTACSPATTGGRPCASPASGAGSRRCTPP